MLILSAGCNTSWKKRATKKKQKKSNTTQNSEISRVKKQIHIIQKPESKLKLDSLNMKDFSKCSRIAKVYNKI